MLLERHLSAVEAEALLAMGRLDGALAYCGEEAESIYAGRVLRQTLIGALRHEGYAFTESRFQAWFAGLSTLSDDPSHKARPSRALCEAILIELTHSAWPSLTRNAANLLSALLAPQDLQLSDAAMELHTIITQARAIIDELTATMLAPLPALDALHDAVAQSTVFAPLERTEPAFQLALTDLRSGPHQAPLWAVEMLYGNCLVSAGALHRPIPLVGLLRPAVKNIEHADAQILRADGLREVITMHVAMLAQASALSKRGSALDTRRTSRAPAVLALLSGFGAMRSAQIEQVLQVTRLGVRGILQTLLTAGEIEQTTVSGAHLYAVRTTPAAPLTAAPPLEDAFSDDALDEFEASMAQIDRLLNNAASRPR